MADSPQNLEILSLRACEQIDAVIGLLKILDNVRNEQGFDNDRQSCFAPAPVSDALRNDLCRQGR